MSLNETNDSTNAADADVEAKIAEIEEAIIELTDLCESHDELMSVLRTAIADKRRENAILAALPEMDEETVATMVSEILDQDKGKS